MQRIDYKTRSYDLHAASSWKKLLINHTSSSMDTKVLRTEVHSAHEKGTSTCAALTCERPVRTQAAEYARCLGAALSQRKDLVLDMTSLKSCLDPAALPNAEPMEPEVDSEEKVFAAIFYVHLPYFILATDIRIVRR